MGILGGQEAAGSLFPCFCRPSFWGFPICDCRSQVLVRLLVPLGGLLLMQQIVVKGLPFESVVLSKGQEMKAFKRCFCETAAWRRTQHAELHEGNSLPSHNACSSGPSVIGVHFLSAGFRRKAF